MFPSVALSLGVDPLDRGCGVDEEEVIGVRCGV